MAHFFFYNCLISEVPLASNAALSKLFVIFIGHLWNALISQLWLTFAPVADQSAQYFYVSLANINWLSVVYMVVSIPLSFATTWMLDMVGLRFTV